MSFTLVPAQWIAGAAGHVGETSHHLHDLIQRGAMIVRAGQKAFTGDVVAENFKPGTMTQYGLD